MAASTAQRAGIWVIAVAMVFGTIAGFIAMILSSQNQQQAQNALQKYQQEYAQYQAEVTKQQEEFDSRGSALSKKYRGQFVPLKSRVSAFDAESVTKLESATIKKGNGTAIKDDTTYAAYYIGFNPKGKIFDSSLDSKSLKTPLIIRPGGVIAGWSEGMKGKKIGGIYELTIPSDMAYGEQGSGEDIGPNMPLKFIIMPVEKLKTLNEPEITEEVLEAYGAGQ